MKQIRNLTFLLIVFALAMPVPAFSGDMDMQDSSHMMLMKDGTMAICDMSNMGNDSNMNCKDDCASLCTAISSSVVLPSIIISNSVFSKNQLLLIVARNFRSVFPESIHHPPIVIS